jgi:predicted RNA polymerase sigma factor
MVNGPAEGLALLDAAGARLDATGHRRDAVRAHLLDELGDHAAAREHYLRAARDTLSLPERCYLLSKAGDRPA